MKCLFVSIVAAVLSACSHGVCAASAPLDKLERVSIAGHDYIQVRDWAGVNKLDVAWLLPGKTIRVSGAAGNAVFTGDSTIAVINGVNVVFSFPVVVRANKACVSLLDLRRTIVPLLFPAKGVGVIRLVALDPGHGGKDKGFSLRAQFEKTYTLLLAQELQAQLRRAGLNVILTRSTDTSVEKSDRTALARQQKADLFVSLHFNSAGESSHEAKGVEVYCVTPAGASSSNAQGAGAGHGGVVGNLHNDRSVLLAWQLQKSLVSRLGMEDRGVKRARFEVLCEAAMPAVLIEGGFLSNPAESRRVFDPAFRREMAKAIVDGILAFKRAVEPERNAPQKRGLARGDR